MLERIRTESLSLMNEKGMSFTVAELANRLAVSKRCIYKYFDSKIDLVEDVLAEILADLQQQLQMIVKSSQLSTIDKVKALMTSSPKALGPLSSRIVMDVRRRLPSQWDNFEYFFEERWLEIRAIIERGEKEGEFRSVDLNILRQIYRGSINELNEYNFLTNHNQTFQSAITTTTDILINGIIAIDKRWSDAEQGQVA